ncbi:hypothetical protein EYF80_033950 [Liparis tanakae]|uniref:Fibronectin type-III domain-containing protein n=1 Tax=Liparis tanakae TaxID=230148 RepID=A0A4Z2GT10_9TELE|nr:hypothetical protein EYF80_033950 [Liparis tanakae]
MEFKGRVRGRISLVLLVLWNIATTLSGKNLHCTNDFSETFICHIEAPNCTEYNLTLRSTNWNEERKGTFTQCDVRQCCCSVEEMTLILTDTYNVTVWKGGESMESKIISVTESIKTKPPKIVSVRESNGNFHVKWKPNIEAGFRDSLTANVTYHKKGDTEKVTVSVKPMTVNGLNNFEILGRNLEPSTTYAVSVSSYTPFSGEYSDSSEEWEFTSIIITAVIFVCFVKLKTKWWDSVVKSQNPKFYVIHPSEQKILKPGTIDFFSIAYVEPLVPDENKLWSKDSSRDTSGGSRERSGGASLSSSTFSYANTEPPDIKACVEDALNKVFGNIGALSHLTAKALNKDGGLLSSPDTPRGVRANDAGCGSDFINKTYSILLPGCQTVTGGSEVQTRADLLCESTYHPIVTSVDPQAPALVNSPPGVLSTDMSYRPCNADSVGFPSAGDSGSPAVSSGADTMASCDPVSGVEAGRPSAEEATEPRGKAEGETAAGEKPAGPCSFPPMDDDYQPFQSVVERPDVWFSRERSDENEEHLKVNPEGLFTQMDQSIPCSNHNVQGGRRQMPFLLLMSADQSTPTVSDVGYQSV